MFLPRKKKINMWGDWCVNELEKGILSQSMCKANHYSVHFKCLTIFCQLYLNKAKVQKKKHIKPKGNNIVGEINVIENRGEKISKIKWVVIENINKINKSTCWFFDDV